MYQTRELTEELEMSNKQYDSIVRSVYTIVKLAQGDLETTLLSISEMLTEDKDRERFVKQTKDYIAQRKAKQQEK
ncbi:MAG: hypothetical protein LBN97_09670 [Oscillospiraceae bacterium]|jgi:hypothetical protein|nr:hypothetical protein [Oscillospiraceae bacterium]